MKHPSAKPSTTAVTVGTDQTGKRLDVFLASQLTNISRTKIQDLIEKGNVVSAFPAKEIKSSLIVLEGQSFLISIPAPKITDIQAQPIKLDIVFEDKDLLVVNKPVGLVVHPGAGNPDHTLINALVAHCPNIEGVGGVQRPGLVHRLDKDTSGLLVAAKSDSAYQGLVSQLKTRKLSREYLAIVKGELTGRGTVDAAIGRHAHARKRMEVRPESGRKAVTHFISLQAHEKASLLLLKLETGRTHQIRAHMDFIKHPVLGDSVYGGKSTEADRQMLHAFRLSFSHPKTRKKIQFQADPPKDFAQCVKRVGFEVLSWKKIKWS